MHKINLIQQKQNLQQQQQKQPHHLVHNTMLRQQQKKILLLIQKRNEKLFSHNKCNWFAPWIINLCNYTDLPIILTNFKFIFN